MADRKHTFTLPDGRHEIGLKMCMNAVLEEAWGFQCPELPLDQTFCIWLLSLDVSLAPELSGNLILILCLGHLSFRTVGVPPLLSFVSVIIWPRCGSPWPTFWSHLPGNCSSSREASENQSCSMPDLLHLTSRSHLYLWVETKQRRPKTKYLFSTCAFLRFSFQILKPLPGE